jgi:hypothetical protein
MKKSKSLFPSLKSVALVVLLASLTLASGFAATNAGVFTRTSIQSFGNPSVRVWVNTNSGVYHCPNTRWYGKTKSGKYMKEKEAHAKGYRPAYGIVCGYNDAHLRSQV